MKHTDLHILLQNSILTSEPLINPYLQNPPKGNIADRVAIYADGFYARLEEALYSDYETLATVLGENKFRALCRNYLEAYPSQNFSLNCLGEHLSVFLTEQAPYNKKGHLAEIAAFEWAEYQAIVAADTHFLSPADLQQVPVDQWPELRLKLHPSATILIQYYNSLPIIKAARAHKSIPPKKILQAPQAIMIWRRDQDVRFCTLDQFELTLIKKIQHQTSFTEICQELNKVMPEAEIALYLVSEINSWLKEKILFT